MQPKGCVFCDIVNGTTPAEVLYENEHALAVLDIHPIHYGHTLIIPRRHCKDFIDVPCETYHSLFLAANVVSRALVERLGAEGYNIFSNNGLIAGQSVFHFHLHVTPRYPDDNIRFILKLKSYADGEMKRTGNTLREHIHQVA